MAFRQVARQKDGAGKKAGRGVGRAAPLADTIRVYVKGIRRAAAGRYAIFLEELEQVHVIGKYCRSLRLQWIAGIGVALALSPVARGITLATTSTTLSAASTPQSCLTSGLTTTLTTLTIVVTGSAPSGTVNILDNASQIASATLNGSGQATASLYLGDGSHALQAVYAGDAANSTSNSNSVPVSITAQCDSSFVVSVSGITPSTSSTMTLSPGESGTATVTVTPSQEYVASLNTTGAPAFVTVSCSGLPSLSSCTLTPADLEILPGQDAGVISTLLIQTESGTVRAVPPARLGHRSSPVAWAILLPGMLGMGGLAWGARRRRWLQRLALVLLVGLVTTLGTAGCSPLHRYYNDGPSNPHETPTGTFNVTVTGQSSNGVTAITNSTTMVLTVQ
jgi:hypothetical protein